MARRILSVCLLLLLSACGDDTLYSGVSEQAANEMVAVLFHAGLAADKSADAGGSFSVSTSRSHFAAAVDILQSNGLPRVKFDTIGEVFARQGFVSSPLEERARLMHALSQEIAHTISSIDGVLVARVHLAVPENDALNDPRPPSSASVFVKHRADRDLSPDIAAMKALVVNGVEGLPYENVTVALFAAAPAPVTDTRAQPEPAPVMTSDELRTLRGAIALAPQWWIASAAVLLLGSALLLFRWLRARRQHRSRLTMADSVDAAI